MVNFGIGASSKLMFGIRFRKLFQSIMQLYLDDRVPWVSVLSRGMSKSFLAADLVL